MKYTSTRNSSVLSSFEDAICSGYAPDGGLFVPCSLPPINPSNLKLWSSMSFPDIAFQVMRMFISADEIPDESLRKICHDSFVNGFDHKDVIPLKKIGSSYIVELFHGPTFCFKDLG